MSTAPTLSGFPLWWRILVIGGLWGSSFPLLRLVAVEMDPFALGACRGAFAAAGVLIFMAATGQLKGGGPSVWRAALVLGTCNGWVPNVLTAVALDRIEAAPAALIHAATPLIVALMVIPLLREDRPGARGAAGLLLGFAGIAVILGPAAISGSASFTGGLLILMSGVAYATGTVYARKARPGASAGLVLGQQLVSGSVGLALSLPTAGLAGYDQPAWVYGVIAFLAIVASALPLSMFLRLLTRARVTDASMVGYIQPPFAAGVGALLLGEWPDPRVLLGGAIVLAGVWLATSRPRA